MTVLRILALMFLSSSLERLVLCLKKQQKGPHFGGLSWTVLVASTVPQEWVNDPFHFHD